MVLQSRVFQLVTAIGVVVVLAAGVTAAIVHHPDEGYPAEWDPRVLDLAHFVERERGALYDHPVPVDFLSPEEYSKRTRTDEGSLSAADKAEMKQFEGEMRALGILSGDTDLLEATNDLSDSGTLAYYDSQDERVVVRGTTVSPGLAVTLVHELTHVLQDQVFALDRYNEADEEPTSGQTFAFDSLVEGDADRIEQRYTDTLDQATQDAIDAENAASYDEYQATGIPVALDSLFGAIYAMGDTFVTVLESAKGQSVDGAFNDPPISEEQVFDVFSYLDGDDPADVAAPGTDGKETIDEGDFGAVSLMVVLAERIDPRQALAAATGWGGDAYAVFPRDGRTCIRLDVTGDTSDDTSELADALAAWVDASPGGAASTSREGDIVHLESCDPGAGSAATGTGGSMTALQLAATRTSIAAGILDSGTEVDQAQCFATAVVDGLTDDELAVEDASAELVAKIADLAVACR